MTTRSLVQDTFFSPFFLSCSWKMHFILKEKMCDAILTIFGTGSSWDTTLILFLFPNGTDTPSSSYCSDRFKKFIFSCILVAERMCCDDFILGRLFRTYGFSIAFLLLAGQSQKEGWTVCRIASHSFCSLSPRCIFFLAPILTDLLQQKLLPWLE